VERKDALNIAAAEPHGWEAGVGRMERGQVERSSWERPTADKAGGAAKKAIKTAEVANVVMSGTSYKGRRCRFHRYMGCTEDHAAVSYKDFRALDVETKRKALEESNLCTYIKLRVLWMGNGFKSSLSST
jgi:hypothetical protein